MACGKYGVRVLTDWSVVEPGELFLTLESLEWEASL